MATKNNGNLDLPSRVSRVEGILDSVVVEIANMNRGVKELTTHVGDMEGRLVQKFSDMSQPKWPLILGIASIVLTIITFAGGILLFVYGGQRDAAIRNAEEIHIVQRDFNEMEKQQAYYHGQIDRIIKEIDECKGKE